MASDAMVAGLPLWAISSLDTGPFVVPTTMLLHCLRHSLTIGIDGLPRVRLTR